VAGETGTALQLAEQTVTRTCTPGISTGAAAGLGLPALRFLLLIRRSLKPACSAIRPYTAVGYTSTPGLRRPFAPNRRMPPLAAAVAMLGAILMAEKCVSSWILRTYPAERELMPYARLVDDPTCLAMARATEIAVKVGGEIAAADPVALERCPQLLETYPTPKPLAEQLVAAPRPDTDVRDSLDSVRTALTDGTLQAELNTLGLELARSRAEAFVGDGMVHLVRTRDVGRDVLRPWLCAEVSGPAAATPFSCAEVAKLWRWLVALCSWSITLWLSRLSIRSGSNALCVRGVLYHGLSRLWRCMLVLCTTLPLADHKCRLVHFGMFEHDEGSSAALPFASPEELAVCVEQFMRFRITVALTVAGLAVASVLHHSESRAGHTGDVGQPMWQPLVLLWHSHPVWVLVGTLTVCVLLIGVIGESIAMIGYTADAVSGLVMMPALWWASGPLAKLVDDGSPMLGPAAAVPELWLWLFLGCGAALAAAVSHGTGVGGHDELWCAPLRGWLGAAAVAEVLISALGSARPNAGGKTRTD
jgi:hypothetical protein